MRLENSNDAERMHVEQNKKKVIKEEIKELQNQKKILQK